MSIKYKYILLCFLCLGLISCETEKSEIRPTTLSFPVGRAFLTLDEVYVFIGENNYKPDTVKDNCGGYWISIPREDVPEGEVITIRIIRKEQDLFNYHEEQGLTDCWTEPSYYIDSDNEMIKQKAIDLTASFTSVLDKSKRLESFVSNYFTYTEGFKYSYFRKASQSFLDMEGTCMNMSRLYIALCRSVGIPARSVWGTVLGVHHHQWSEVRDEDGYWHAADFGFTKGFDVNDIRYLDLFYGAEENDFFLYSDTTEIMIHNLKIYNGYPVNPGGSLGFKVIENNTNTRVIEYNYSSNALNMN